MQNLIKRDLLVTRTEGDQQAEPKIYNATKSINVSFQSNFPDTWLKITADLK